MGKPKIGRPKIEVDYDKVYYNHQNKPYKIIKEVEPRGYARVVQVQFLESGNIKELNLYDALKGRCMDFGAIRDKHVIDYDKIYINNDGLRYRVIKKVSEQLYEVLFIDTNDTVFSFKSHILKNKVSNANAINYDAIYHSNDGDFKILGFDRMSGEHEIYVKIKFIESGNVYSIKKRKALKGIAKDCIIHDIDFDKIYYSKFSGPYKIIEEVEPRYTNGNKSRQVKIVFLDTNNVEIVALGSAKIGSVKDRQEDSYQFDKVYLSNNYGPFIVLERVGSDRFNHILVKIKFIETGTICIVKWVDAKLGGIRDPYRKVLCGVACIGNASSNHPVYSIWNGMIERCYNPKCQSFKSYGAKGVTVCERWHCFEYFLQDLPYIQNYDLWCQYGGKVYNLDKDLKQQNIPIGRRVYSLETCIFLRADLNSALRNGVYNNKTSDMCVLVNKPVDMCILIK